MSTLSGNVSKGEKGKSKFQSLDINNLYKTSRGESLEQHQQKNTIPRKHGMQSLGKVPARRPPANLPSVKSEQSGSDPAVSLVPSGGSGWATTKDPATTTTNTTSNATTTSSTISDTITSNTPSTQCATGAAPATALPLHPSLPGQQNTSQTSHSTAPSWSAIMSRPGDVGGPVVAAVVGYAGLVGGGRGGRGALGLSFLAHQSPQFQHEFPSLSGQPSVSNSNQSQTQQSSTTPNANPNAISVAAQQQSLLPQQSHSHSLSGDGTAGPQQQQSQQNRELNAQYGPGPSLRPQTEGSWIQGGSRTASGTGAGVAGPGNGNTPGAQGPPHIGIGGLPGHAEGPAGGRPNLGQPLAMGMAQVGPNGPPSGQGAVTPGTHQVTPNLHNYRGLISPFMYRGSFPGGFPSQFPQNMGSSGPGARPRFNYPQERFPAPQRQQERERPPPPPVEDEIITRPIIKEEDLTRMDDISRDAGWAAHDDIDYNQKLAFSDDEPDQEQSKKDEKKEFKDEKRDEGQLEEKEKMRDREREPRDNREQPQSHRGWNQGPQPSSRDFRGTNGPVNYPPQPPIRSPHPLRGVEEEEIWNQRRREQGEKVASTVERARQRKEEEEKRFQESLKQAADKKLQDLEQKIKEKHVKQKDDDSGFSSEPKSLISVPAAVIPVPDWERDRENRESRESRERDRSRTSSEGKDEKPASRESRESRDTRDSRDQSVSEFRQITQIERPSYVRQQDMSRNERDRDRDQREIRERDQPAFSKHFQSDLPPRFQKQQAERTGGAYNRVSPNSERPNTQLVSFSQQYDPSRWVHSSHPNMSNSVKKQSHSMPLPQRRNRTDSELSGPIEDDRPPSRDHRGLSRDDRYRHSAHRSYEGRKPSTGGYYDDHSRYIEYEYVERHPHDSWERGRHYDDRERDNRDREKKDYDNYPKQSSVQQSLFDDREPPRERPENPEWRDDRGRDMREERVTQERQSDNRRDPPRDDRIERSERPQRPDSRDSRASRESRTSLRDDETHKSRDCGSWVNDIPDYEEKKRDLYREDNRDRRQPPGPVTREKIEADELKGEKRNLTQLKRSGSELDRKDCIKDSPTEAKKELDVWTRKLDRSSESNRTMERGDNSPKAWADAISPTFEMEDDKALLEPVKDDKEVDEMKQSMEKLSVDSKREDAISVEVKEDLKDEKREKNIRNRTNSGSSRGRESARSARPWGGHSVYTRGWRGSDQRGRRGGPRSSGRPGSARSGSYGHTDSELSGDEISGSTESGKEERRPARSPKPFQKLEKDDRNREVSRREDKRSDYPQVRSEKRGYEGRSGREGFAPSGEPTRRGRGGFRNRGPTTGGRMNTYGPPPSKSPFSTERNADDKETSQQKPSTPTPESELPAVSAQSESTDDKIIAKQQALTAGITGRHTKSPSQQSQQQGNNKQDSIQIQSQNIAPQRSQGRKDDGRTKRNHSGSRRTQGRDHRDGRCRGNPGNAPKQNSSDVANDDWETTSDNSEEHIEDRKESRNARNKPFVSRGNQSSHQNPAGNNQQSRRNDQPTNNREQRERNSTKPGNTSSRAPGAEKRNSQNASYNNQRNHSGSIPPLMQNTQTQNGRPRSQGSANSGPPSGKPINKESTVNRVDEIKLNDPNLVNQALNDINKKSAVKEKKVVVDGEAEVNNYSGGGDDGANSTEDKIDADGFQEVRSKKNVKESRHSQKEEAKPLRREKEKERERDRSKSKSNGPQPTPQQIQNIPPLLGQPIPQPANLPQKQFDRDRNNRQNLAPRFMKARLAKQQQQMGISDANDGSKANSNNIYSMKDSAAGPAPPPSVNAWDKPFTSQIRSNSPSSVPADIQLMSGLTGQNDHNHDTNEQVNSRCSSQRNSPNTEKGVKTTKEMIADKNVSDGTSPPVQTLIFENTNYSKTTKSGPSDMAMKSKFSNHIKSQPRIDKRGEIEDDSQLQQHQQQALSAVFSNKSNELMKDKSQEPIQMPLSFSKNEDNADMKLDFTFDSELSQLTEDAKTKSLGMPRSIHMTGGQSTISPSTAELNLKIASVKKVWENAPPMPTVVEHEDGNVVTTANSFPQPFESNDVDDSYSPHQQYNQNNMKNEIATSTNVCKLVPPQVKPQQQSSGSAGAQPGSTVPGPSPIGPGQSPIGHPSASLQGPLSPPPFNSTGQPSHINYQEFPQYPGSQAAQYGGMSAIPSPPAVLFNTGSGQLPAQAGGLYGAFQLDQSRSPFTQYPPYAQSLQSSFNQQSVYLQQPPPPPHAPSATPDMYQNNLSQYRITTAAAPPFGQNQQLSNNPNTVLISSSSNSLMSASVKPSTQPIGAIGTKAPHFQAPSAPQPNQLAYIPYDPNQVLGVSGSYMGNSQLVQRPGPSVQPSGNSYYSASSAGKPNTLLYVFPGSQTGFYQPGGAGQQTGTPYGLQGFGQHSQSLATGSATPVGLQNFSSQFLSGSGLQMAAAAAAQQYRNPTGGLPGPGNAGATFLGKHQQQEQSRQLKSPSGNQQDVLASVFSSTPQIPSPKSRNCKQQTQTQQPQPSPTQIHKYQQYQGATQSALVLQQNVRGMGMPPPRAGIQPSQQRYPAPIQRPAPFPTGPNPNQSQQQQNCMPTQQQQQAQINRHRGNIHQQQQQQQQRNMKMQQQYYSSNQGNVKMDSSEKQDSHNEKMSENSNSNQAGNNKANVNQQDGENKEEVDQQNE